MTRILIHAGFHKTGTTSVQDTLMHNLDALRPHYRIFTRKRMNGACASARAYSAQQTDVNLLLFASEMATLFDRLNAADPRPVIFSSEDLTGHMPGRHDLTTYNAAPALMASLADTAAQAFETAPGLTFYFSTRASEPWLRSCYAQHLRATRMTDDYETYLRAHAQSAQLDRIVEAVRAAVAPHTVTSRPLEMLAGRPLGPLAGLLDALGANRRIRRAITPVPPAKPSPPQDLLDAFPDANRSDLDDETVLRTKGEALRTWLDGPA